MANKLVETIQLSSIKKLQIYVTNCRKSLSQVKKETGADYVLNAGMWNSDGSACPLLKVDGVLKSKTPWTAYGYGWNTAQDISMTASWNKSNFIAVTPLILNNQPIQKLSYAKAQGGVRGRSAIGLKGNSLVLYCTKDGSSYARSPEALRTELVNMGLDSAVMLDGGGSSQCNFKGNTVISSSRKVHNWILVFLGTPVKEESKGDNATVATGTKVNKYYIVTPSVGINIRSGPSASYKKVGAYSKDTIIQVTEISNGWGKTNLGWVSLENCKEQVEATPPVTTRVTDNGIKIKKVYIPSGAKNRPAGKSPMTSITIHETGNYAKGADANAHATYLASSAGASSQSSWHYTVDDKAIVQHLPDNETAYHAGDGANGQGNTTSISIEICVNADGDFIKAKENAASLVRLLKSEHSSIKNIYQHNHWNGKDCPYTIRHSGQWDVFVAMTNTGVVVTPETPEKPDSGFEQADSWANDIWKEAYDKKYTDGTNPRNPLTRQEFFVIAKRMGLM